MELILPRSTLARLTGRVVTGVAGMAGSAGVIEVAVVEEVTGVEEVMGDAEVAMATGGVACWTGFSSWASRGLAGTMAGLGSGMGAGVPTCSSTKETKNTRVGAQTDTDRDRAEVLTRTRLLEHSFQ